MTKIVSMIGMAAAMAAASAAYPVQIEVVNEHWADTIEPVKGKWVPGLSRVAVEITSEAIMERFFAGLAQLNMLRNSTPGEDGLWVAFPVGSDAQSGGEQSAADAAAQAAAQAAAGEQAAADEAAAKAAAAANAGGKKAGSK